MMSHKASGGGQLVPQNKLSLGDILEHLASRSGVPSQLGRQLDEQKRLSTTPQKPEHVRLVGKEEAERLARAREDKLWRTMRIKPDSGNAVNESARLEMALLRSAQVMACARSLECADDLSEYGAVGYETTCSQVRAFAKRVGCGEGRAAIGVLRAFEAWRTESAERGHAEVYAWMRARDPELPPAAHDEDNDAQAFRAGKAVVARRRATAILKSADHILGAWVERWNARSKHV